MIFNKKIILHFLQLSCASTLLQSTRNVSIKIFSKFRSIPRIQPALWVSFFYKVTGLQPSGLQHRCFLVNNMKFLRTPILKNICEPLLLFSSQLFEAVGKKPILKTKWQKLINKYENAFIWTLHAAMKRNHWNVSLNLYYRHTYIEINCF